VITSLCIRETRETHIDEHSMLSLKCLSASSEVVTGPPASLYSRQIKDTMSEIQEESVVAAQKRGNVAVELIAGSVGGASQVLVGQVRFSTRPRYPRR
jgi:hypothetical protein